MLHMHKLAVACAPPKAPWALSPVVQLTTARAAAASAPPPPRGPFDDDSRCTHTGTGSRGQLSTWQPQGLPSCNGEGAMQQ